MPLVIDVAVAKTHKHATRESGDTAEIIERPTGGVTLLIVDGQGSGRGARVISQLIVARCLAMLKEGVRDGVVARAASDILLAHRHGQVSATLDLVSVDLAAGEIVITRQGATVGVVRHADGLDLLTEETPPLGRYRLSRPMIWRYPIRAGLTVIVTSDGITASGQRLGLSPLDLRVWSANVQDPASAQTIADQLLAEAIARDAGRPADDCTVGVVMIQSEHDGSAVRRMSVLVPVGR